MEKELHFDELLGMVQYDFFDENKSIFWNVGNAEIWSN